MPRGRPRKATSDVPDVFAAPEVIAAPKPVRTSDAVYGAAAGEFVYIHAYVCPQGRHPKHPYVVVTPGSTSPSCQTCGSPMRRHFFSKRKKDT